MEGNGAVIEIVLSILSGCLLILIFPKIGYFWLAYVALAPLLIAVRRTRSPLFAAFCGFICGAIFLGGALFWLNTLSKWAGPWVNLAWVVLTIFQAFFIAGFAAAFKYSLNKYRNYGIIAAPLLWAAFEWLRSLGPYGVTGGDLSYSQAGVLPVLQVAFIFGSYGISFLVVLVNEALAELTEKKWVPLVSALIVLVIAVSFGFYRANSYRDSGKAIKVAVIQANIDQDVKLDFGLYYEIANVHMNMSRVAALDKPDIIIWPETAVTTYLFETRTLLGEMKQMIKESKCVYLIGTPYRDKEKIYNSVVAVSAKGDLIGRYDKQRLVPFGEYLPLRPLFYRLLEENPLFAEDYNSDPHPKILDLGIARAGVVICFESTLPYIVRNKVKQGAQFLLVATNDAWFFDSSALYQHLAAARLRAVESNMYVIQAANTGISAIIDPTGRIVEMAPVQKAAVLSGKIYVH